MTHKYHIGWIESRTPDWKVWIKENQYWIYTTWKYISSKDIWDVAFDLGVLALLGVIAYGMIIVTYNQSLALQMDVQQTEFQNFTHYME